MGEAPQRVAQAEAAAHEVQQVLPMRCQLALTLAIRTIPDSDSHTVLALHLFLSEKGKFPVLMATNTCWETRMRSPGKAWTLEGLLAGGTDLSPPELLLDLGGAR